MAVNSPLGFSGTRDISGHVVWDQYGSYEQSVSLPEAAEHLRVEHVAREKEKRRAGWTRNAQHLLSTATYPAPPNTPMTAPPPKPKWDVRKGPIDTRSWDEQTTPAVAGPAKPPAKPEYAAGPWADPDADKEDVYAVGGRKGKDKGKSKNAGTGGGGGGGGVVFEKLPSHASGIVYHSEFLKEFLA